MTCRNTRRADQRAPGSNHGASGSAWSASRSDRRDELVGVRGDLLVVGQHAGQRLARLEVPVPGVGVGTPVAVHRLRPALGEPHPDASVAATCLISPPR